MTTYARSDQVRAHFFELGALVCDPDPTYYSCIGVEGLKHENGDVKIVECPDPERYGNYVQVDEVEGQVGRWTTTINGRVIVGQESPLRRLHRRRCRFDLHLNRGVCDVASDVNGFSEVEILEDVRVTSYSTSPLASISSDNRETTTETIDISARYSYTVYNLTYALMSAPVEAGALPVHAEIVPTWCCKTAECQVAFNVTNNSLWYTFNSGVTWTQAVAATAGSLAGGFRVGSRFVLLRSNYGFDILAFNSSGIISTTNVPITGMGTIGAYDGNGLWGLFSTGSVIYRLNATASVVCSYNAAGFASAGATITSISLSPDGCAVAAFSDGNVIYSNDGYNWAAATDLPAAPNVTSIAAKSCNNWLLGTSTGLIYCTADAGVSWTSVLDKTAVAGSNVYAIEAVTSHVIFASVGASVYRSVDGGATWTIEPAEVGRSFITVNYVADICRCPDNPNFIMLSALDANGARVATGRSSYTPTN